jgi:hypothetical protein
VFISESNAAAGPIGLQIPASETSVRFIPFKEKKGKMARIGVMLGLVKGGKDHAGKLLMSEAEKIKYKNTRQDKRRSRASPHPDNCHSLEQ